MTKLRKTKVCSCGRAHNYVPETARKSSDAIVAGFYFECSCKSTLIVPFENTIPKDEEVSSRKAA